MNIGHDLVQRNAPAGAALLPASDRKRSKLARGAANSIVSRRARKRLVRYNKAGRFLNALVRLVARRAASWPLSVERVEALGAPAGDRREKFVGLRPIALSALCGDCPSIAALFAQTAV